MRFPRFPLCYQSHCLVCQVAVSLSHWDGACCHVTAGPDGAECNASRANLVQMAAYLGGSARVNVVLGGWLCIVAYDDHR